jgi:hypothetical protein
MALARRSHAAYADLFGHISADDAQDEPAALQLAVLALTAIDTAQQGDTHHDH